MERFTDLSNTNIPLSTLEHASISPNPSTEIATPNRFYRGPVPASNDQVDNVYNFYMKNKYFNTRIFQPTV